MRGRSRASSSPTRSSSTITEQATGQPASWRTSVGTTGSCSGTFREGDDRLVTFRWKSGCFGDWQMKYAVDAERVSWSDQKALAPYATDEDQNVTEVFNSVPWRWTRAAS